MLRQILHGGGVLFALPVLLALAQSRVWANDIIVDVNAPNCDTLQDGSSEFPFCSIQAGIDAAAQQGVHGIAVVPGIYNEQLVFQPEIELQVGESEGKMAKSSSSSPPSPASRLISSRARTT